MKPQYFLKKIKDVKATDYLAFGKLVAAYALKPLRQKYRHCWVVCETPNEARDNGYHFYKYVRTQRPDIACYYALSKRSPDLPKVAPYGNIVPYGSVKHWLLYLLADYNISSQKGGKPNAAVCAFLELMGWIDSRFVFLQHGITINDCAWAHADTTQLEYFVTGAAPETAYIQEHFGYDPRQIVMTGFPRFDNLHICEVERNYVLIMPTWRSRFSLSSERQDADNDFAASAYKRAWEDLLNSPALAEQIERHDLKVVFFPHRNMQQFLDQFRVTNERITVADWRDYDIQEEMKKARMMITDYSSVFFDMVYMQKPVIFYQFDYDDFRRYDYEEGYFDYKSNPFGAWCETAEDVTDELARLAQTDFAVSDEFRAAHAATFPLYDDKNSERLVEVLEKGTDHD